MRWRAVLLSGLVLGALCGAAGCRSRGAGAPSAPTSVPGGFPVTVRDALGREITLPKEPVRIASLSPAHTETLFALGVGDRVALVDTYSDFPSEVKQKPRINCWPHPPLEPLVAAQVDLVVVFTEDAATIHRMEGAGLRVLKLFPTTFEQTLEAILTLGNVTGREERAEQLVAGMRSKREAVRRKVVGRVHPRVMLELDALNPNRPYVAGRGGLYGELLTLAGAENVFGDQAAPAAPVTTEAVIARDPEVILLGDTASPNKPQTPALVRRRAGWSQVAAVRTGRIFPVDGTILTRPAPRLADGLMRVAELLHSGP